MKNIKKYINIIIIIVIFLITFSNIMSKGINDLDEIWNYNFAKNIADGLIPYRDFNIVQMPLLSMICAIFLKIFGNELLTMRILASILMTAIFYMTYKILEILTTNKKISSILILLILLMFRNIFAIDYNYANLLIALILTFIELKHLEKTDDKILIFEPKRDFIIGIIAGLSIIFKQTTGICISLACIGYKIFAIKNKEDIKEFLKIAFVRLSGVIIPCILMVIYLIYNRGISNFIDYAILGIKTFSNKIPYKRLFYHPWYIKILAVIVPITIVYMFLRIFFRKKDNKNMILFAYAISSFVVAFPITDKIHFLIGSLITILGIIYIIRKIYSKIEERLSYKIKAILYGLSCGILTITCLFQISYAISDVEKYIFNEKETELNHYYGVIENKEFKEKILEVEEYIKTQNLDGKKVYILDAEAAIYMIPLDIYNKDYDMFLKGNLGSKGEDGIIERIDTEKNAIYLIRNDSYSRNWQNPEKVRKYIQENLRKTGEVYIFDIYEQ